LPIGSFLISQRSYHTRSLRLGENDVCFSIRVGGHMDCLGLLKRNRRNKHLLLRGNMKICEKCQGSMVVERAVDLEVGLSILYFACLNCGKRIQAEKEPRPLVH
jgi:hypothetical protein